MHKHMHMHMHTYTHSLTPNNNGTNQRRRYSCPSSGRWRVTAIHTILLHRTMERTVGEGGEAATNAPTTHHNTFDSWKNSASDAKLTVALICACLCITVGCVAADLQRAGERAMPSCVELCD